MAQARQIIGRKPNGDPIYGPPVTAPISNVNLEGLGGADPAWVASRFDVPRMDLPRLGQITPPADPSRIDVAALQAANAKRDPLVLQTSTSDRPMSGDDLVKTWINTGPLGIVRGMRQIGEAELARGRGETDANAFYRGGTEMLRGAGVSALALMGPAMGAASMTGVGAARLGAALVASPFIAEGASRATEALGGSKEAQDFAREFGYFADPFHLGAVAKAGVLGAAVMGGIKKAKPPGITGLDESAIELITKLFPKLDTHNKNTAFITPKVAERKLRAAGADDSVIAKVQSWFDARKLRPAAPGELPTVAQGEVYTQAGRTTRRAVNPEEVKGQIAGAPLGITNSRQEREARKKYIQAIEEGRSGRFFYDDSAESIFEHASRNELTARQFTRGLSVTSPQTSVPSNTDFAIKGHNQAIAGVPVETGKYPVEMGKSIDGIYQSGDKPLGPKREPFSEQIAEPGGYRGKTGPIRPVNDIWQGEVFGYIKPDGTPMREGFSAAQHAWMDKQMDLAIREAIEKQVGGVINWNTGNAQAAGWAAAKIKAGDIKLEEAAQAYHTFLDRAHMVMSRDNFPVESSQHLAGLSSASREVQDEFAIGIRQVLYDEKWKDLSFKQSRMLQDTGLQGEGVWAEGGKIYMLPGNQVRIAVGQQKRGVTQRAMNDPFIKEALKDGSLVIETQPNTDMRVIRNVSMDKKVFGEKVAPKLDQVIDNASLGLAQSIESQMGLLTGASAVAGTKVNPNTIVKSFNTVDIILPEATMQKGGAFLSDPRIQALIQTGKVVPIPLVDGVRLKNIEMEPDAFASIVASLAKPRKVRGPKKGEDGNAAGELAPPYRMSQEGQDQGFFIMNNWAEDAGTIGQAYIQAIANPDIPNSIAIFNETAPARAKGLGQFYRAFSAKYGYPLSAVLMDMNDHVAEYGFEGVKMVAKKYGVDLSKLGVLMATVAMIQAREWDDES